MIIKNNEKIFWACVIIVYIIVIILFFYFLDNLFTEVVLIDDRQLIENELIMEQIRNEEIRRKKIEEEATKEALKEVAQYVGIACVILVVWAIVEYIFVGGTNGPDDNW